jgi:hypothetical protein
MVVGVIIFAVAPGDDYSRAAIARAGCRNSILFVIPARFNWQAPLEVAEDDAVALIRNGPPFLISVTVVRASLGKSARIVVSTGTQSTSRASIGSVRNWVAAKLSKRVRAKKLLCCDRLAIDLINGSELLRQWVDDLGATPADLDNLAAADEKSWIEERESVLLYK